MSMLPASLYPRISASDGWNYFDVYGNYGELWLAQISTKRTQNCIVLLVTMAALSLLKYKIAG